MLKCGLDGYFFIRFLRAIIVIFLPLMVIVVIVLLPINFNKGKGDRTYTNSDVCIPELPDPVVVWPRKSRSPSLEKHDLNYTSTPH